ncbi:peptidase M20 [Ktedonospora formicarum]|uniref:Peptidase M20 n=2 Tax=Ktedonospora formicarum TaxID=2778364 RepID=A0A8J3HXT5_9CHLR|nr:peptidase M20 [Ktedonospora formicarum]
MVRDIVLDGVKLTEQAMPRYLEELQALCLLESPSDDPAGLNASAKMLATLLQRVDMQTTIVEHPRGNAVVGTLMGDNPHAPTCLLIGHHDTVHPLGAAQERTRLDGERFYSPGTVDMKAGLLQGIYALEVLKKQGYRDFNKILFLSVPDEEISSRYHVGLIRQIAQERPYVFGLEGASKVGTVVIRRKGCAHYRLTAEGAAAHAGSSPERGRNAVLELAHQIVQAQSFMHWRKGFTINAGPIRGGSRPNVVSDFAEIVFDIRFLYPQDRIDAIERWHELLQNQLVRDVKLTLTPEPDSMVPMVATDESLALAEHVRYISEQILQTNYAPETRGGASDCCNMAAAGCPSIDGLGAIGGGAHTSNEYALLPPVPARVGLIAGLIVATTITTAI